MENSSGDLTRLRYKEYESQRSRAPVLVNSLRSSIIPGVKTKWTLALPILLMLVFALTRWPGMLPNNFSAAYALAFCAGVYFPGALRWWLPLTTLLATDVVMNVFYYKTDPVSGYMIVNYVAYLLIIALGRRFTPQSSLFLLIGGGLIGAILFYLLTNTAAWIQNPVYAKTFAGWIQALTVGSPGFPPTWAFFRATLLSGGLFTGLFAGAMKLGELLEPNEEEAPEAEADEAAPEESKA